MVCWTAWNSPTGWPNCERLGGDPHPLLLEEFHQLVEAAVLLPDEILGGHAHAVVSELGGVGGVPAHRLDLPLDLEALAVGLDDDRGDPAVALAAGPTHRQHVVGDRAVGDEGLHAVDDVLVAVPFGGGFDVCGVAAVFGLGVAQCADQVPACDALEDPLLLLAGTVLGDHPRPEGGPDGRQDPRVGVGDLVGEDGRLDLPHPRAAELLGDPEPDEVGLDGLLPDFLGPLAAFLVLAGDRFDLLAGELPDRVPDRSLLCRQREIDHTPWWDRGVLTVCSRRRSSGEYPPPGSSGCGPGPTIKWDVTE
jgi:hypothetical protein